MSEQTSSKNPDKSQVDILGIFQHPAHRKDSLSLAVPYSIEQHRHLHAAWAASRGASVVGCRFKVHQVRQMLEACGYVLAFSRPNQLPAPEKVDQQHRLWRVAVIKSARCHQLTVTNGVAAKLINFYLKHVRTRRTGNRQVSFVYLERPARRRRQVKVMARTLDCGSLNRLRQEGSHLGDEAMKVFRV